MKYLIILLALMFGCDKPNGGLSDDVIKQLKEMQDKQNKLEHDFKFESDYLENHVWFLQQKEGIEKDCKRYIELKGFKNPKLNKDYKANILSDYMAYNNHIGTTGEYLRGCEIYLKDFITYKSRGEFEFIEAHKFEELIKDLLYERENKKG